MKHLLTFILSAVAALFFCSCASQSGPRTVEDFNFDWKFTLGDNTSYSQPETDDGNWRGLHLPHDWAIEGEFSKDNPSKPSGGALPGGIGWYRKNFKTATISENGRVFIEFDGVFMNSTVYVNGQDCGTRPYGYSSFTYDITDKLNPAGQDNLVAVRCDNELQPNSRWYAGCGIYRDVRLVTTSDIHVAYHGTYVTTPSIEENKAEVCVQTKIASHCDATECNVRTSIVDKEGKTISSVTENMPLAKGENILVSELSTGAPHLWDINDCYLYTVLTEVLGLNDKVLDRYETEFGFRTAQFDPEKGFFLNGNPLKLLGVCLHHDMGCLGSAVHRRALEREMGIMKEMGCNAIRTSHNPPSPILLDICDKMGFLVMDEALDMWRQKKTQYDYARIFDEWHERDIMDFMERDRNHPSIIMWSIGNEIPEQWSRQDEIVDDMIINFLSEMPQEDQGENNPSVILSKHMASIFKKMDPTRPITSGCNEPKPTNNIFRSGVLDVYGINYHTGNYDDCLEWYKGKCLIGSETASAITSRGLYFQPSTDTLIVSKQENEHHQLTGYDSCFVPWGDSHEHGWYTIKNRDYMAGTFVWTGFDYLGEPTPYGWPSRSSYFGIVDLAGFPKDAYWMYQSEWTDKTVLHLFPHWNWKDGDFVDVWAYYNNADEVELFVNGKSFGKSCKEGERLHAIWTKVPFEKGQIEVVSYKDGNEVAHEIRKTSGAPASLRLTADRDVINANGYDLSYVTVEALDADGIEVPDANLMLHFEVSGKGELVGVDNGSACDTLSLKGKDKALFSGKALGVVRSLRNTKGTAKLTVSSEIGSASIDIKVK